MSTEFDLVILGSGPAGFSAAMQASKFDKRVLIIEADDTHLGGAWINTGTVPSKALREAAMNIHRYTRQFGNVQNKKPYQLFQMRDLLQAKHKVMAHENAEIMRNLIKNEVATVRGFGRLTSPTTVDVTDTINGTITYTAHRVLISTGCSPTPPTTFTVDHKRVLDSRSILTLEHIPRRLIVIGAGVQAIEYATSFAALGTKVTILNDAADHLTFLDPEIKAVLDRSLADFRITVVPSVRVSGIGRNDLRNCTEVTYTNGDGQIRVVETEQVLYFGGRTPNTSAMGLEQIGVITDDQGFITVDGSYRTSVPGVYAAGDVTGFPQLASASFSQGRLAACDMFEIPVTEKLGTIPFSIYSYPEISSIGLTEQEALDQGFEVTVGRAYWENLTKAVIAENMDGMLKLVFESGTFRLLGVHIIGMGACEIIHLGQTVMALDGDIRFFINHMMNYPTYAEAYRVAAFNGVNRVHKAGVKYRQILGS
jgi:NAD(P) transhydrogenase